MFKTQKDSLKYGYSTGRIKVLETKLLDRPRVERLIEAKNLEETLHILTETDYGEFFEEVKTQTELEKALSKVLLKLYLFLEELEVDEEVVSFFRLKYDFLKAKFLLKAKYLNEPPFFLEDLGKLKEEEFFDNFKEALAEVQKKFSETKDLSTIDRILDKHLYRELCRLSLRAKNKYLQELTFALIDLANLKTFLRAKNLGHEKAAFEEALLEEGFIAKEIWLSLYPQPLSSLLTHFEKTPYGKLLEIVQEKADLTFFDKFSENFLLRLAKKARLVAAGLEPVVGYILAKENEVSILRIILKGKLKGFSPGEIKPKLRELYV